MQGVRNPRSGTELWGNEGGWFSSEWSENGQIGARGATEWAHCPLHLLPPPPQVTGGLLPTALGSRGLEAKLVTPYHPACHRSTTAPRPHRHAHTALALALALAAGGWRRHRHFGLWPLATGHHVTHELATGGVCPAPRAGGLLRNLGPGICTSGSKIQSCKLWDLDLGVHLGNLS
jgi:hypothetical protein